MVKISLLDKIIKAQENHNEDLENIIEDFTPLIRKFASKLYYEDAFADLRLEFIEIILGINIDRFRNYEEGQILSYIKISMKNAYIKLSRKACIDEMNVFYVEDVRDELEKSHYDNCENAFFEDVKKYLTPNEFDVVYKHFLCGLTISNIASEKGISRQAVNQLKSRAIKKLSKVFEE